MTWMIITRGKVLDQEVVVMVEAVAMVEVVAKVVAKILLQTMMKGYCDQGRLKARLGIWVQQ